MKVFYVGAHKDRIYHTSRHKHDMFEVVYYFSGDGTVVIEDTEIHFTGGDIFVIPPNTPHSEYSEKGYCTYHYTFNDIEYSQKGYRRMRDNETEDFLTALSQMHSEYWMRRKNWTNIVDAYHEVLMGYIISFFARSSANPYVVSLVGKLEDNISNTNFDVREEMKKIPLNPDYFKKIFTSEMGMTPNRYLFNIRMAHAQKLLGSQKTSHLSIKEIARQCGYENYYYFSRKFSSFYGVSPRGWLKHLSGEFQETPLNIAAERNTVFEKKEQGLFNDFSDSEKGLFPEDAYSVPSDFRTNWFECKNGVGCTAASRALLDEKYFFECGTKSALHNGRQTSLWYFNRKPGAAELPMLTVDAKLRHLPLEFSLDVCNASAQPVKLVALLDEVAYGKQGNSFSAAAETVLPYEETTLTFDFSGQTGHLPLTPVLFNCIRFYVENCRDGEEYKLYLSGFRAVIRENTEFARFEIKCEKTARAGHALRIGVTAEGCFDEDDDLSLELVSSGHVYSRFRLSRDEKLELKKNSAISFTRQLLPYIPEEKYKLIAAVNSYRVRGAVPKRITVINDGVFGFPNVKRVKRGGVPALTVNGGALEWNGFADYDYMPGTAYQFGAYGSNVFVVPCNT
ncbi:MAG: AraC family transcriptional regulator, partial [Clostridia bacterium]|nr:AraC family transcriptional regulator [Clostridia bacterium]